MRQGRKHPYMPPHSHSDVDRRLVTSSSPTAGETQRCCRRRPGTVALRALPSWLAWWSTSTPSQCRRSSTSPFKERVSLSIYPFASHMARCKGGVYPRQ